MPEKFFVVNQEPQAWADALGVCHAVVTIEPWNHGLFMLGRTAVIGRNGWLASKPIWKNEVIYYNTQHSTLKSFLNNIVIHHTTNSKSISENEKNSNHEAMLHLVIIFLYPH